MFELSTCTCWAVTGNYLKCETCSSEERALLLDAHGKHKVYRHSSLCCSTQVLSPALRETTPLSAPAVASQDEQGWGTSVQDREREGERGPL